MEFVGRIQQYMEKAIHEAKVNLSWLNPNPEYVEAINAFIEQILSPRTNAAKQTCSGIRCRNSFPR